MSKYSPAAEMAQDMILKFLKDRMKEKKVKQNVLAGILGISASTLIRYFKKETPLPLGVYLEICGVLELRPYLIPAEVDPVEMQRIFFN